MPALFTRMSRRVCRDRTAFTAPSTAAGSVTSIATASARPPAAVISATAAAAFSPRAAAITVAPLRASAPAMARPIPRDAPVTRATLPSSIPMATYLLQHTLSESCNFVETEVGCRQFGFPRYVRPRQTERTGCRECGELARVFQLRAGHHVDDRHEPRPDVRAGRVAPPAEDHTGSAAGPH